MNVATRCGALDGSEASPLSLSLFSVLVRLALSFFFLLLPLSFFPSFA